MNLKTWLEDASKETGEVIQLIVLYPAYRWSYEDQTLNDYENKILSIEDVPTEIMTNEFSDGYGGNEGPNFTAWSSNYVYFPDNYDGSESIQWMPRQPMVMKNFDRPGGG